MTSRLLWDTTGFPCDISFRFGHITYMWASGIDCLRCWCRAIE
jgi:hypothetical protein